MSGNDVVLRADLQSKHRHPWPMLVPDLLAHRRRPPRGVSSPRLQAHQLVYCSSRVIDEPGLDCPPTRPETLERVLIKQRRASLLPVGCRPRIDNQPRRSRDRYRFDRRLVLVSRPRRRLRSRLTAVAYHLLLCLSSGSVSISNLLALIADYCCSDRVRRFLHAPTAVAFCFSGSATCTSSKSSKSIR